MSAQPACCERRGVGQSAGLEQRAKAPLVGCGRALPLRLAQRKVLEALEQRGLRHRVAGQQGHDTDACPARNGD